MFANSRPVVSNQSDIHPDLESVVLKHKSTDYKKPISDNTLRAFNLIEPEVKNKEIILDSFCGTAESTVKLATAIPILLLLALDRSSYRLNKNKEEFPNAFLIQADVYDFCRLASQHGWEIKKTLHTLS